MPTAASARPSPESPSHQLKLIGVTGTNGKTTTSCLIAGVLLKGGYRVGVAGTLGYFDGEEVELAAPHHAARRRAGAALGPHGRPTSVRTRQWKFPATRWSQGRIAGVRLDVACVTNVSRDHLNYHGTLNDYRLAKSKIFDYLGPGGICGGERRRFRWPPAICGISKGPALTIGIDKPAEITAAGFEQCTSEQTFLLTAGSETVPVSTRMIGTHHIYNCLTAAAVGLTYGIDLMAVVARTGSRRLRARPLPADRMRRTVQRLRRLCPHARRLRRRLANPAASNLRAG